MSGKADALGPSSAFGRATTARSVRRQVIDATLGGEPNELPLDVISDNPDNPRDALGDITGLAESAAEVGIVNAITVVSVDAWLRDRPERAGELADGAQYVVVDGHHRLAAAREAKLPALKVTVNDAFAASDEAMLEAAFVANVHRTDMTELEEAQALEQLVKHYGSQHKAAKRLGKSQGWINQRISLLHITPALQADLAEGRRVVEDVRSLKSLPPEQQVAKADERAAARRERAAAGKRERETTEPSADYGVITPAPGREAPAGDYGVITPRVPEPQTPVEETPAEERPPAVFTAVKTEPQPAPVAPTGRTATVPIDDDRRALEVLQATMSREVFGRFLARAAQLHEDVAALEA